MSYIIEGPSNTENQSSLSQRQPLLQKSFSTRPGLRDDILTLVYVSGVTLVNCFLGGIMTITLPEIVEELDIGPELELWPVSIFALTAACTLLLCGSLSDRLGSRRTLTLGSFLQAASCLACGLARTGTQIIVFRGLSGFASSLCLPSATSIVLEEYGPGKKRSFALAAMSGGQPVGFALGITGGGLLAMTLGWQWGFYISAVLCTMISTMLASQNWDSHSVSWSELGDIDWFGACLASSSISLLLYGLLDLTRDASRVFDATTITYFGLSCVCILMFVKWQTWQEAKGKPVLIKNSLWNNGSFCALCANSFIVWGSFNACEQLINFIFQRVQGRSTMSASLMFLPTPASAVVYDIFIGLTLHRVSPVVLVVTTNAISSLTPTILAFLNPTWSYWVAMFPALLLSSVGADASFCVSNSLLEQQLPEGMQGLASGVFNTASQLGKAVILALTTFVINVSARTDSSEQDESPEELMDGYKTCSLVLLGFNVVSIVVAFVGLRGLGKRNMVHTID